MFSGSFPSRGSSATVEYAGGTVGRSRHGVELTLRRLRNCRILQAASTAALLLVLATISAGNDLPPGGKECAGSQALAGSEAGGGCGRVLPIPTRWEAVNAVLIVAGVLLAVTGSRWPKSTFLVHGLLGVPVVTLLWVDLLGTTPSSSISPQFARAAHSALAARSPVLLLGPVAAVAMFIDLNCSIGLLCLLFGPQLAWFVCLCASSGGFEVPDMLVGWLVGSLFCGALLGAMVIFLPRQLQRKVLITTTSFEGALLSAVGIFGSELASRSAFFAGYSPLMAVALLFGWIIGMALQFFALSSYAARSHHAASASEQVEEDAPFDRELTGLFFCARQVAVEPLEGVTTVQGNILAVTFPTSRPDDARPQSVRRVLVAQPVQYGADRQPGLNDAEEAVVVAIVPPSSVAPTTGAGAGCNSSSDSIIRNTAAFVHIAEALPDRTAADILRRATGLGELLLLHQ